MICIKIEKLGRDKFLMKRMYALLSIGIITIITAILISGCNGFIPDNNPDVEYDEEDTILEYMKVVPNNIEMSVNQSQKFEVRAYNSNNKKITIDAYKIKWIVAYQCPQCGVVWKLSSAKNSLETTFTPLKPGNYKIFVSYEETGIEWPKANVTVH